MYHSIQRVLIVGLGSIGRRHVRIIRELYPGIKITALRHSHCDAKDIDALGLYDCVTTLKAALAFRPDAAIVATPATKHLDSMKPLAEAGIHLLVEKPISATTEGVQILIDLCHKKEIILMTAYNLRFLPSLAEFRRQLQNEKVGKILSVRAEVGQYLPDWRPNYDYRKTVSAQKRLGGGVLLELSHEIDYLLWIFGSIKWTKSHVTKQSDLEINVEDTANIILGFKKPLDYQLTASLNMDFIRHDKTRQCIVIGKKGTLRWNGIAGQVLFFPERGKEWEVIFSLKPEKDYTYTEQIKHFFSSIERGEPPLISGEDGLETVLLIEKIHRSSRKLPLNVHSH